VDKEEQVSQKFHRLTNHLGQEISGCEHDIQALQRVAAATYEGIAENLPKIISEINTNNDEARALIEYFISGTGSDSSNSLVLSTLEEARDRFVAISNSIHDIFKVDQKLFKQINNKMAQIEKLRNLILEIANISNDIELLSYNAVFVASQAGSSGAAFSHIAKEIKNLSNFTNALANRMRLSSEAFEDNYRKFSSEIERVNKETIERLNNLDKNLSAIFSNYNYGLRNISELILQTLRRADQAKERVPRIMASLQAQDYVRQILDEVSRLNAGLDRDGRHGAPRTSVSAEELVVEAEEKSARHIATLHLAEAMGEKVFNRLNESVVELGDLLRALETELIDIESDRLSMVDFFSNKQVFLDDKSSIQTIFDESSQVLHDLFLFIRTSIQKKRDAGHYAKQLRYDLKNVETNFEEMRNIIRQFNVVKVISKMEIAREASLSSNITASSEMFEELTDVMDKNIVEVRVQIDTITHYINESLAHLDDNLHEQEAEIEIVGENIETSTSNLSQMRDHLNDAVRAVGNKPESLFNLIRDSLRGVDKIGRIVNQANALTGRYQKLIHGLRDYRLTAKSVRPELFTRGFDTARFADLVQIDKKYAVYSESVDDARNFTVVHAETEQAGELTLFKFKHAR
jgi:hypothetical protein